MAEQVTSVAAGTSGTGSTRKPTASATRGKAAASVSKARPKVQDKELVEAMSVGLSVVLAGFFQFVLRVPKTLRDQLDPTTDEADAFVTPFARLINRPSFGNLPSAIVNGADWMVALAAAMAYHDRTAPILKASQETRKRPDKKSQTPTSVPTGEATANGNVRQAPQEPWTGIVGAGYGIGPQHLTD